ncbi:MAG TPA: hypothetical protein VFP58_06875, partial [Candidatus Eisenbacteria bacterium]|nr:hypothetical protein [Candidatus Eisenbacteria bacterium]
MRMLSRVLPRRTWNLLIAIALGPATLVITPLVGLVTFGPFLLLAKPGPTLEFFETVRLKLAGPRLYDLGDVTIFLLGLGLIYLLLGTGV